MTAALILLVAALAATRATRVVVDDKITEPIRMAIAGRLREGHPVTYLVHCTWCTGLWIATAVAAVAWWGGLDDVLPLAWWAGFPLTALAVGWAVGTLKRLDSE